jgi:RNA polymerase sigma-70 factor, ECF subfamily
VSIDDLTEPDLLDAARTGDHQAFRLLVAPHLRALHLHGYRMLGSYDEAEEAVQDVLLRAWRGLDGFAGRAPLLHWLYRITTTTCLKAIEARGRRPVVAGEVAYLQPYPDRLLDQLTDHDTDPAAQVVSRDTVALAFITALQRLPATQRAVLILRDVLAFTAQETADLLGTTVAATNSALQRARATMPSPPTVAPLSTTERDIVDRFVRAWCHRDVDALAAVLRDDVTLHMPPDELVFSGPAAVTEFFTTVPAGGRTDLIRLAGTRANGQPALAAYLPDDTGTCRGYGIMLLTIAPDGITAISGFPGPNLFAYFDLPLTRT